MWDPQQYARFSAERSRPFYDLFERLGNPTVARAVDLGCGSGELTRLLSKRWRGAEVLGLDSSQEMLAQAQLYAQAGQLRFEQGSIETWTPKEPLDLIFSNAALQWVPDHETLLPRLASWLGHNGVLAVQMPDNFSSPSHLTIGELVTSERWQAYFSAQQKRPGIKPLDWYVTKLLALGMTVDAWATEYMHVLAGEQAVLEWVKGTALRPILAQLQKSGPDSTALQEQFLAELGARLEAAYPAGPHGTLFPFRRIFFIARKKA